MDLDGGDPTQIVVERHRHDRADRDDADNAGGGKDGGASVCNRPERAHGRRVGAGRDPNLGPGGANLSCTWPPVGVERREDWTSGGSEPTSTRARRER